MPAITRLDVTAGSMFLHTHAIKGTRIDLNAFLESGGTVTTYRMRAHDSGSGGRYVYWTNTTTPDTSPDTGDTTPNFTGSLTVVAIIGTG